LNNTVKSIAIGSFDGLHIAHKALIDQVEALVIIERNVGYLTPGYKRSLYTSKECYFYHFDKIKSLSSDEFIDKLKIDFPKLEKIVVGYDFKFGKEKMGNANSLKDFFSGSVVIVDEVRKDNVSVHSKTITQFLKESNIKMGNDLLGRKYCIDGSPVKGQGLGKEKFVPTININVSQYLLPKDGVYATRTKIEDIWYESVTFLGHRETTDGSFAVETHLLYEDLDEVQSDNIWIEFECFLRDNSKFSSFEELKKQIDIDILNAKKILPIS